MADLFWLSDGQWAVIGPFMPRNQPGARRADDRRVLSGIVRALKSGGRWRDCPEAYGPPTTVYNRYHRWSRRGSWRAMLAALAGTGWIAGTPRSAAPPSGRTARRTAAKGARTQAIGPSRGGRTTKVHVLADVLGRPAVVHPTAGNASDVRTAPAAPGRLKRLIADRGHDADHLRCDLEAGGTTPVIPGSRSRERPLRHDKRRYQDRWRIEAAFCRLKGLRRVATRHAKLAANFASAIALAAVLAFWC